MKSDPIAPAEPQDASGSLGVLSSAAAGPSPEKLARVDQAYRDYLSRTQAGERIQLDSYCDQFPDIRSGLCKLLQVHFLLEEDAALFGASSPAAQREMDWPRPGSDFLDYHLLGELGRGAFSRVYLATEASLGDRLVALKLSQGGADEAGILGRSQHSNIVPVYSTRKDPVSGLTLVCMPYLGSATLNDLLDKVHATPARPRQARVILDAARELAHPVEGGAKLEPDSILVTGTYLDGVRYLGAALAEALAYLHERGICHRDLKPSNVLLRPDGTPLLLDFNLSADFREELAPFGGTLPYMAPEQLREFFQRRQGLATPAQAPPDARADLFSFGVMLYELATGQHPFGPIPVELSFSKFGPELLERQRRGPVAAITVNPEIDERLSTLIQRCLAYEPTDRPSTAAQVAGELQRSLAMPARAWRWIRRHPRVAGAASVGVLAVVLTTSIFAALQPTPAVRHLAAAQQLKLEGKHDEALQRLDAALDADPNNAKALFARARVYQHLGKHDLAIGEFRAADAIAADGRNKAGIGYSLNLGSPAPESALEAYRQAVDAGFGTAAVYNNMGYCCHRLGLLEDAERWLQQAIEADPSLASAYHMRALAVLTQARRDFPTLLLAVAHPNRKFEPAPKSLRTKDAALARLRDGIADAKKAMAMGSPSGELDFLAAQLYAFGASLDASWVEPALTHLKAAGKHGYDLASCDRDQAFHALRAKEAFQAIRAKNQPRANVSPAVLLVDPNLE